MPNKEHLRLWVEDLESGQHRQIKGHMAKEQIDGSYSYCCLGRLCEIAMANDVPVVRDQVGRALEYDGRCGSYVPLPVAEWVGVSSDELASYADDNDSGMSFERIAYCVKQKYGLDRA